MRTSGETCATVGGGRAAGEEVAFRGSFLLFSSTPYRRSPIHRSPPFIKVAGTGGEELLSSTLGFASSLIAAAAGRERDAKLFAREPEAAERASSLPVSGRAALAVDTETVRRGC